jgi:hypothetical protein
MGTFGDLSRFECTTILREDDPRRYVRRTYNLGAGVRFVGKCKCGKGLAHLALELIVTPNASSYMWLVGANVAHVYDNGACLIPCECGKRMRIFEVRGKFSAKHVCNAKCLASKSGVCECSCGGKNHGASWG